MNTHIPDFYIRSLSQTLTRAIPQEDPVICGTQEREEEFENSPIPSQTTEILFHSRIPNTPLTPRANYEMSRVNRPPSPFAPFPLLLFSQRYRKLRQGRGPWRPRHHATAEAEAVEAAGQGWAPADGVTHPSRGPSSPIWARGKISWVSSRAISSRWWVSGWCLDPGFRDTGLLFGLTATRLV